jgi:hypothetical protein
MNRIRFNIAGLLGVILVLGVGFAALRESSDLWESGVFTLMIVVLLMSILLAIHRTQKRRAFWLGFALVGSIYLTLSLFPSIESRLITTKGLALLDSKMPRSIPRSVVLYNLLVGNNSKPDAFFLNNSNGTYEDVKAMAVVNPAGKEVMSGGWFSNALAGSNGTTESFIRVGHSLIASIAAILGGLLSRHLHAKVRERSPESVNSTGFSS